MSQVLVHPVLKRGHSNWLEASHNVLIRFRPKHINLECLHFETSTNLGLQHDLHVQQAWPILSLGSRAVQTSAQPPGETGGSK